MSSSYVPYPSSGLSYQGSLLRSVEIRGLCKKGLMSLTYLEDELLMMLSETEYVQRISSFLRSDRRRCLARALRIRALREQGVIPASISGNTVYFM